MSAIQFSTESNPLTAALPTDSSLSAVERAVERFRVGGNAIVTGGAGGLGIEAVRTLLEHGAKGICILDLASAFESAREEIQVIRGAFPAVNIIEQVVDVTDEKEIENAVENTAQQLGSVDTLVCFAGIPQSGNTENTPLEAWNGVLGVNLTGSWLSAKHVGRQMIKQETGGSIVFIASLVGHKVMVPVPATAYSVSKTAILGLTKNLAAEWARYGIRVNSISPGYMNTKLVQTAGVQAAHLREVVKKIPLGRMGQPSELVGPIVMLCSPAGRYITGTDILIDGGWHIC